MRGMEARFLRDSAERHRRPRPHSRPSLPELPLLVKAASHEKLTSRKVRRLLVGVGVTFIAVSCITALAAAFLTTLTPPWWDQAVDPATNTNNHAQDFESLLVTELNRVRQGSRQAPAQTWQSEPWAVAMRSQDVNSWLTFAAPRWVGNQSKSAHWPKELSEVRVRFDHDHWYVGARIKGRAFDRTITAIVLPRIAADGSLWLDAQAVELGSLSLPADLALNRAPKIIDAYLPSSVSRSPEATQLLSALLGQAPLSRQPVLKLADGRKVRILDLKSSVDRLEIVARTERY